MSTHFSIDIETDGVVAGRNNMLSLGAAAIDMLHGVVIGQFKVNLELISGVDHDPDTMRWWKDYPDAYRAARFASVDPAYAIKRFVDWVQSYQTDDSIMVSWRPDFDHAFVRYYIHRFHPNAEQLLVKHTTFSTAVDIKTVVAIALRQSYRETKTKNVPNSLRIDDLGNVIKAHSHDAREDAVEQAYIYYNAVSKLGVNL